jgi:peptidoglycan-associated lipoprotein
VVALKRSAAVVNSLQRRKKDPRNKAQTTEEEKNMVRKTVGLTFCAVLLASLALSTGCARKGGSVSPKFAEAEGVTVEVAPPSERATERIDPASPTLGAGDRGHLEEGELPIRQTELARELIFEEASRELKTIYFDYDKSTLKPAAKAQLEKTAAWLKKNPEVNCQIEGHCDERGTNEYNLALGERRALAARRYLVSLGINPDRIFTISYGEERPDVEGHDESAWKFNRRDEFKISF